jgi:hypothetical protein
VALEYPARDESVASPALALSALCKYGLGIYDLCLFDIGAHAVDFSEQPSENAGPGWRDSLLFCAACVKQGEAMPRRLNSHICGPRMPFRNRHLAQLAPSARR